MMVCYFDDSSDYKFQVGLAEERLAELVKEHESKKDTINHNGSSFVKLCQGLLKPNGFKPLLLLTFLFTFQQFSGIYVTIFYAVTFFKVSKYLRKNA